jgi:penicillin amidase
MQGLAHLDGGCLPIFMAFSSILTQGPLGRMLGGLAAATAELAGAVGVRRWLLSQPLPPRHENLRLPECRRAIDIRIDRWGVPHIQANDPSDVFFAQGYCHARDRFWQMELNRRVARGELAELFGEGVLDLDRIFRRLGFRRAAEQEMTTLDGEPRTYLEAYTAGANAYLKRHRLPIEHYLLRLEPQPWRAVDSLAFARYMAWNLTVSWETKLIRMRLGEHAESVERGAWSAERAALSAAGGASNNWVVSAARSATGRPLLANDPHLRPRMPAVWYVAHLQGAGLNVIGATLAGIPGVMIGHNEHLAWGVTAGMTDSQDLFLERRHPEDPRRFANRDGSYEAEVLREEFRVRGQKPVIEEVVRTRHGPLLNGILGVPADGTPIALKSTTDDGCCSTKAILAMNRAKDWPTFRAALAQWTFPTLNFVYADVHGTIAYKLAGRVPVRPGNVGREEPVPGWSSEYDWLGEVPFDDLPEVVNPPSGFWATANSEPECDCKHFLARYWMDDTRQRRIAELLQARPQHSLADLQSIQTDIVSLPAQAVARRLSKALSVHDFPELRYLAHWDGRLDRDSAAGAIYSVFRRELVRRVHRDLPPALLDYVTGQGIHEMLICSSMFFTRGSSRLLDLLDELLKTAAGKAVVAEVFRQTLVWLRQHLGNDRESWHWGRLHRVKFPHVLGESAPLLQRLLRLSRGPFAIGGDFDTIAQAGVDPWHPYNAATFTVSYRQLLDVGAWDQGRFILPSGQSGHPGSEHYDDLMHAWLHGEYVPMLFYEETIERETAETIRLRPNT